MIHKVFVTMGADRQVTEKIKHSALTEDNIIEFIGELEQNGINLMEEYSYLLAEVIFVFVFFLM
jgi:hypothetical protein